MGGVQGLFAIRRRLLTSTMVTVALGAGLAGGVVPASAQAQTVTLTLLNGLKLTLNVPDGSPLSQLQLPPLLSPIVSETLGPVTSPTTSGGALALPGVTGGPGTPTTLAAGPAVAPTVGGQQAQKATGLKHATPTVNGAPQGSVGAKAQAPQATPFRSANGLPTALNPTLTAGSARPGADRRAELLHRQVPDPAVPAPDLPGGRHPVRACRGRSWRRSTRSRPTTAAT